MTSSAIIPTGESYSTLTLLEHMHLLSPNLHHDGTVDLFVNTLGFGLDPKSANNLNNESGVVFVNCGSCQLHLNDYVEYCQRMEKLQNDNGAQKNPDNSLPLYEIGLRYNDLSSLKQKLSEPSGNSCSYKIDERGGREMVRITDTYGRMFVARESTSTVEEDCNSNNPAISSICQQKVIRNNEKDNAQYGTTIAEKYGTEPPACQGMDYIEFFVPVSQNDNGKTVTKIAKFYDFFFDAPTSVANDGTSHIAIIGFGKIDENGRAEQSLLFRERLCEDDDDGNNPPTTTTSSTMMAGAGIVNDEDVGTGHHIAIYVGANDSDFEAAATNCMDGGILWVNKLFEDRVLDVDSAMQEKQFRFKDIVDIENGNVLYALEHEIRSVSHELFPGNK